MYWWSTAPPCRTPTRAARRACVGEKMHLFCCAAADRSRLVSEHNSQGWLQNRCLAGGSFLGPRRYTQCTIRRFERITESQSARRSAGGARAFAVYRAFQQTSVTMSGAFADWNRLCSALRWISKCKLAPIWQVNQAKRTKANFSYEIESSENKSLCTTHLYLISRATFRSAPRNSAPIGELTTCSSRALSYTRKLRPPAPTHKIAHHTSATKNPKHREVQLAHSSRAHFKILCLRDVSQVTSNTYDSSFSVLDDWIAPKF